MAPKPHGNDSEIILLVDIKRKRAKEALANIIQSLGTNPGKIPNVSVLLDYLSNMVCAIELILKLMSSDWESHKVGEMFKTVFGVDHPDPALMKSIRDAIMDQKYLYEPAAGLKESIPQLEYLFENLHREMGHRFPTFQVVKGITLSASFGEFLRDHIQHYVKFEAPITGLPGDKIDIPAWLRTFAPKCEEKYSELQEGLKKYLSFGNGVEFQEGRISVTNTGGFGDSRIAAAGDTIVWESDNTPVMPGEGPLA